MIWLILVVLLIPSFIYVVNKEDYLHRSARVIHPRDGKFFLRRCYDDIIIDLSKLLLSLFIIFLAIFFIEGSTDYKYLINKKNKIESYRIIYPDIFKINGLIVKDNNNLNILNADFLKEYADALSEYNGYLENCKYVLTHKKFWWFRESMFMNKDILGMEYIKIK